MLRESIDQSDNAGSAGENGSPLFESEVGGDDGRIFLMATADDVVKQVGGSTVAGQVAGVLPVSEREREK